MRFHSAAAIVVIATGFACDLTGTEWALIVFGIAMVLAAELFNAAMEAVVDLASPDYSELARSAKDSAAGAVLVSAIAAAVIGLIVFGSRVL